MKKQYTKPSMKAFNVNAQNIIATSGGVSTNSNLGNNYNSYDVSYGKRMRSYDYEW